MEITNQDIFFTVYSLLAVGTIGGFILWAKADIEARERKQQSEA